MMTQKAKLATKAPCLRMKIQQPAIVLRRENEMSIDELRMMMLLSRLQTIHLEHRVFFFTIHAYYEQGDSNMELYNETTIDVELKHRAWGIDGGDGENEKICSTNSNQIVYKSREGWKCNSKSINFTMCNKIRVTQGYFYRTSTNSSFFYLLLLLWSRPAKGISSVDKRPIFAVPNKQTTQVMTWEDNCQVWRQTNQCNVWFWAIPMPQL